MSKKNKILVVGSLAYDHVMQFDGLIKDVVVPGNYNMAFTASSRALFYGGCAGNISYSLRLLGENPIIMTVVGNDFEKYRKWLEKNNIDTSAIYESSRHLTASAFILTDKEQNQVTFFDPGAMHAIVKSHSIGNINLKAIDWAIIAPDEPDRMIQIAEECHSMGIPYIFDPAQQINMFDNKDILDAAKNARVLIVNEYESELLSKKLGLSDNKISGLAPYYIETKGEKGCYIKEPDKSYDIKAVSPKQLIDPTGCGDAFRSGVLAGLRKNLPLEKSAKIGALMATYSIEQFGTQAHNFTMKEFSNRYENNFGEPLN